MSGTMDQIAKRLCDLPSDVLLQILGECNAVDVLNLSSTCKQLQQVAEEHQVWLQQARRLHVPIPPGATPSKAELKDWVVFCTKVEIRWVKRSRGFPTSYAFETEGRFVDAHLVPGGTFVVILYASGDISLSRIVRSSATGKISDLREVARCKGTNGFSRPGYWSRLLTETSYGCPVLVLVEASLKSCPSIFLIDPFSQDIKKKECPRCNFADFGVSVVQKILAVKNTVFFVCDGLPGMLWIMAAIEPSGPRAVMKTCLLVLPEDDHPGESRVFAVSERGLIVTNRSGIFLYHVPDLRSEAQEFTLLPVWYRRADASGLRGSLYKTTSQYPGLWLQGHRATHTLEFYEDGSGCLPVVANHNITKHSRPFFSLATHIKLRGRRGIGIIDRLEEAIFFHTGILEDPNCRRPIRIQIPGLNAGSWRGEFKYMDLDELTGRVMVVVGPPTGRTQGIIPYAERFYIADLPA